MSSTVDDAEVAQFSALSDRWWDPTGPFKPLHRINPLRVRYIREQAERHFMLEPHLKAPLQGKKLIDIGCGGGLLCEPMARLGADVTGIDASEKNIGTASHHANQSALSIDYRATTAEKLAKAQPESFDIVLTMEVVEHVADLNLFLESGAGLLKPGGMMVLSTLNRTAKSFAFAIIGAEYVLRWLPRGTHQWQKFVTPSEACTALENGGLEVTHLTGMVMHPITFQWSLQERDLDVNYLLIAKKPVS